MTSSCAGCFCCVGSPRWPEGWGEITSFWGGFYFLPAESSNQRQQHAGLDSHFPKRFQSFLARAAADDNGLAQWGDTRRLRVEVVIVDDVVVVVMENCLSANIPTKAASKSSNWE